MSVTALLAELKAKGIAVRLEGGRPRLTGPKSVLTDDLLAQLRKHKTDLVAALRRQEPDATPVDPDPYREMFYKAIAALQRRYIPGALDYLREHHPALYQKIGEADTRLDEVWRAALQGSADLGAFREALKDWYHLHLQGIEITAQEQAPQGEER